MKNITDKLQSRGAQALTDEELVAVALAENPNDDGACTMAEEVLNASGGALVRLAEVDFARLRMMAGMGRMRALKLLATMELDSHQILYKKRISDRRTR